MRVRYQPRAWSSGCSQGSLLGRAERVRARLVARKAKKKRNIDQIRERKEKRNKV